MGALAHTVIEEPRLLMHVPNGPRPHPVLCFLHGAREAALNGEGVPQPLTNVGRNQSPPGRAYQGSDFLAPFLVVSPQLPKERRWGGHQLQFLDLDISEVDAAVTRAIESHGGDPTRLSITGFSYGGEGAFRVAHGSRHSWRSIWAVDPALQQALPPLPSDEVRVWVHHGNAQPGAEYMAQFAGDLQLLPESAARGGPRLITRMEADHPATCFGAYAQRHVYQWLLAP